MRHCIAIAASLIVMFVASPAGAQSAPPATSEPAATAPAADPAALADPYLWLEQVSSPRVTAWVQAENAKTLAVLQGDPRYPGLYADALALAQAKDRIPAPTVIAGRVYNFWQDADHVRGIWRSTTLADYADAAPHWQTTLDLDALARAEHANWIWEGPDCAWPREERCLISLSDGGEDAVTVREFDRRTKAFVAGGFTLPRGKQNATWETADSLLVARAWTPGQLTASGYPYVVKRLRRGQPLAAAVEVFRGTRNDIFVGASTYNDAQGDRVTIVDRGVTFFTSEKYLLTPRRVARLGLPAKASVAGLLAGRLLVRINEAWTSAGKAFAPGSLVAVDLRALEADPAHLAAVLVYAPGGRDSLDRVATTRSRVLITTYHNVRGRAFIETPLAHGQWSSQQLRLADNSSIAIADTDPHGDTAFVSVTGYLTPPTLWKVDAVTGALSVAKSLPPKFDAAKDVVE